jgi:type II secretory pathway pseudopilin PulG
MTFCRLQSRLISNREHGSSVQRRGEDGYTLVALLALMSILALMMIAVAPNVRQQAQRERELEAISRGEEVAEAIRLYILEKRTLPTTMDQLLEGLPRGTKKLQILRPNAAKDPLTESGDWRLLRPKGPEMIEFQRQLMLRNNGTMPKTRDVERVPNVYTQVLVQMNNLGDTKSEEDAPGDEDDSENATGPFIGVVSRSRRNSVINYYGIDRHDKWVFTPLFRQ